MRYQCINKASKSRNRRGEAGFTLLELLAVIAIVGIVAAIGFTGFQSWTQYSQVKDSSQSLRTAVNFARAEAIKHGGRVKVCGSTDNQNCAANFAAGWVVYYDIDGDDGLTAADELLLAEEQTHSQVAITVADSTGTDITQIGFNHRGYPDTPFLATTTQGAVNEQIRLHPTGRVEAL